MPFLSNIAARKKGIWKENCISPYFTQNVKLRLLAPQLHERRDLIEGEGQGKIDVSTLWDIISHVLLTAHSNLAPGVLMQYADRALQQRRVNDGYIDDVDNILATTVMVSGQIMGFHKGAIPC
jgi:hypothetical protein